LFLVMTCDNQHLTLDLVQLVNVIHCKKKSTYLSKNPSQIIKTVYCFILLKTSQNLSPI